MSESNPDRSGSAKDLRVGFIMSTEVGLGTQFLNWKEGLTPDLGIDPEWIVIDWWEHGGLIERTPLVPESIKTRMRAEIQIRTGLRRGPFDALFIAQERVFHGTNSLLFNQPFFITADVTAVQLAAFGPLYNKEQWGPAAYEGFKHRDRSERIKRAAALFPWSNWVAESMVSDYGADPSVIHVVPPGVNLDRWRFAERGRRGGSDGPVNILFVGGDFYRKGGDLLLDWASRTAKKDWMLHIVTRDPVTPTHPCVRVYRRMVPNDPALLTLYEKSDIFVLPTRGDCYSIAAIEAMAAGLPVILSRTGGTPDIIEDGKTGLLIPPGDAAALADRLDHLLENPDLRATIGRDGRASAENKFDAGKNIRLTIRTMRSYMGG